MKEKLYGVNRCESWDVKSSVDRVEKSEYVLGQNWNWNAGVVE